MRPERYITRAEASKVFAGLLKYEATKVKNSYEEVQLKETLANVVETLKASDIDALKGMIYDTAGILQNETFKIENEDVINFVKNYMKKFSYEVKECGFYSYNRGYITVEFVSQGISIEEITEFVWEHFEEANFEAQFAEFLKEQQKNNEKVQKEETICFAKQNGEWKFMLK